MSNEASLLNRVRTESPCASDWTAMEGNDQVRFCRHCVRDVFNLSAMTRREAEALVARSDGRLCVRYVREADGRMVTLDSLPSSSSRHITPRVLAGTLSAALLVHSSASAQSTQSPPKTHIEITRLSADAPSSDATISGVVLDPNGSLIAQARLELMSETENHGYKLTTDAEGRFRAASLPSGKYSLAIEAPGFAPFAIRQLAVGISEELKVTAALQIGLQICETVEIKGVGFARQAEIGTLAIRKRSFWQWIVYVTTYPYQQNKRIFKH